MAAMVARFSGDTSASASLSRPATASLAAALRPASTSSIARRLTCDESDSAAMRTNMCTSVSTWPSEVRRLVGGLRRQRGDQQGGDEKGANGFHGGFLRCSKHNAQSRFWFTQ